MNNKEKEMWEEERRLALMETESIPKWKKTASALEKKLTRKQQYELERDFLIHKNVSDMKNLIEKYYPKGGIPVDWELLKKHNKI